MQLVISSGLDELSTLILSTDGQKVFEQLLNRGELLSVCLDKSTHLPSFIVMEVLEGVGLQQAYALRKASKWHLLALPEVEDFSSVEAFDGCHKATSNWALDGKAISCECDFDDLTKQQLLAMQWHDLLAKHQTGLYLNEAKNRLKPMKVKDSLAVEQLLEQARSDKGIRFEHAVEDRQWLIIERKNSTYDAIALGLTKQDKSWFVWYYALGNSKSFHAIRDIEHLSAGALSATLCIEGCDWWGKEANVDISLDTLKVKVNDYE